MVLKSEGGERDCNIFITPHLPFGTLLNEYSTASIFWKVRIFERYPLRSFSFGRFTVTVCNFAAHEFLKM